jgi:hypothetical protein
MADTLHTNVSEVELLKSFPWLVALDFAKLTGIVMCYYLFFFPYLF